MLFRIILLKFDNYDSNKKSLVTFLNNLVGFQFILVPKKDKVTNIISAKKTIPVAHRNTHPFFLKIMNICVLKDRLNQIDERFGF